MNAALLKHDISLDDLYEHYSSQACAGLTRSQLIYRDRAFYSSRRKSPDLECIGFDAAGEAVRYAAACGLLDFPWHANFEAEHPQGYRGGDGLLRSSGIDAVLSTGCVGYITERTFDRLLTLLRPRSAPWIISYVLRMFDYRPIVQTLVKYGYVTEQLHGQSFAQRRFLTRSERERTVARVRGRCLETTDLEETGYFYADLFLSRPRREAETESLEEIANGLELRTSIDPEFGSPKRHAPSADPLGPAFGRAAP